MLDLPEGFAFGYLFNVATGKEVDVFGEAAGLKRKRWWIFKESDRSYKKRIALTSLRRKDKS